MGKNCHHIPMEEQKRCLEHGRSDLLKHFLSLNDYPDKNEKLLVFNHDVVCRFDPACYEQGLIAR